MRLREDQVQRPGHPDEEPFSRLVLEHPGAAVILAVDDERPGRCACGSTATPSARSLLQLPAGLLRRRRARSRSGSRGASWSRRRGFEAAEWTHLSSAYSSPGISAGGRALLPGPRAHRGRPRRLRARARGGGDGGALGARRRTWPTRCSPARRSTDISPIAVLLATGPGSGRIESSPGVGSRRHSVVAQITEGASREGRRSEGSQEPRVPGGDHPDRGARAGRARPRGLRRAGRGRRLVDPRRGVRRRRRDDRRRTRTTPGAPTAASTWCSRSRSRSPRSTTGCGRG